MKCLVRHSGLCKQKGWKKRRKKEEVLRNTSLPLQVCNHPDLFEGRAIVSAFDMEQLRMPVPRQVSYAFVLCVK